MRHIQFGRPMIGGAEKEAVMRVLDGPILVHGPLSKQFESEFAAFTGAAHAVSVANCTAAMHLAYFHLGLGPGDAVIVPAQTHVATAHAVEFTGARPIFVDAEPATGNIDIARIEAALTPEVKAIAVVHFLGRPVDMDGVNAIARKHNLFVVEDCALAVGTSLNGAHAGTLGHVGCFSFYPVKHMTTGEGGMLTTNDPEIARRIERQRAFGVDRHMGERTIPGVYDVTMLGYNYRMSEIAAALGIEQLKRVQGFLDRRRANYAALDAGLRELDEIELFEPSREGYGHSHYCLSFLLKKELADKRLDLVEHLKANGVGTSCYYPRPVPHMAYYREKYGYGLDTFPVASRISYASVALSVGPHLGEEDMAYMVETIKEGLARIR